MNQADARCVYPFSLVSECYRVSAIRKILVNPVNLVKIRLLVDQLLVGEPPIRLMLPTRKFPC